MKASKNSVKAVLAKNPELKALARKGDDVAARRLVNLHEDVTEDFLALRKLKRAVGRARTVSNDQLQQWIAIFLPLILGYLNKPQPAPTPAPAPSPTPEPTPVPAPTPAPVPGQHQVVGGRAKITGMVDMSNGQRVAGTRLKDVLAGRANAPHDCRVETGFTPTFEDGHIGQPNAPGEPADPYFLTTPLCPKGPDDTDGPMQVVRLRGNYEGAGSCDLAHEYAENGCNGRFRVRTGGGPGGTLTDARYDFFGGSVPIEGVDVIHFGRGA